MAALSSKVSASSRILMLLVLNDSMCKKYGQIFNCKNDAEKALFQSFKLCLLLAKILAWKVFSPMNILCEWVYNEALTGLFDADEVPEGLS